MGGGGGVIFFLLAERVGGCRDILYNVGGILKKISPSKKMSSATPPLQYPQGMQAKSINAMCRKRRRKIKY